MKEIKEIAANYAVEKTTEMMSQIVAQAFADGYRMGYKDREDEIPVDLRDGKTEFVDLGLPSGTLWSNDFEKLDGKVVYQTYSEVENMSIPTEKQCKELFELCDWEYDISAGSMRTLKKITCIGPNGTHLEFRVKGFIKIDKVVCESSDSVFWIKTENCNTSERDAAIFSNRNEKGIRGRIFQKNIGTSFMGYKLPIRLVKNK